MKSDHARVSINLVSWNGQNFLPLCLESIARQTYQNWTVRALDNASTDGSDALVKSWLDKYSGSFVRSSTNIGFAAAHNQLIAASVEEAYILIINQDVSLDPDYLLNLITILDKEYDVGSVGGCLKRWETTPNGLTKTDLIDSTFLKIYRTHRVVEWGRGERADMPSKPVRVFGVPATAALYRTSALEAVKFSDARAVTNYFDASFFSFKEDVDLAYRLQLVGYQCMFVPDALGYHYRSLRGAADSRAIMGNSSTVHQRLRRSSAYNTLSYRNHLMFLFGSFAFPIFSRPGLATVGYEFLKVFLLLFTEPASLTSWMAVWRLRSNLRTKRLLLRSRPYLPNKIERFLETSSY